MQDNESALPDRSSQTDVIGPNEPGQAALSGRRNMKRDVRFFFYFYLVSFPALLLILLLAILGVRFILRSFVLREAERDAIRIAGAVRDSDMGLFVRTNVEDGHLLGILHGQVPEIDRRVRILVEPFDIVNLKVYDSAARVAYSTDPELTATVDFENPPLKKALAGATVSQYGYEEEIRDILDRPRKNVQIVETYVPVFAPEGRVVGCFNLHKDVTADIADAGAVAVRAAAILTLTVLGVFAAIVYVIRQTRQKINTAADALSRSEEMTHLSNDLQAVINRLLSLSLEDLTLEDMLAGCIDYITDIPWLALEPKGAIYLVADEPEVLVLAAQKGLPKPLQSLCDNVPVGECACCSAAASKEVIFTECRYKRRDRTYEGICEHGHYCVPIISGEKVIGVINSYAKKGHTPAKRQRDFLRSVSAVVAGIVERKKAEQAIAGLNEELESAVRVLSGLTKVLIPRGSVFKRPEDE
ncbi:MAG: GAF domain-containing protein [Planctomycetota bacterium]|jgi:putative methionine-R-sulfoxide reductase with GAF domain